MTTTSVANRCGICKRRMVPWNVMPSWLWNGLPLPNWFRGRLDCGGDCSDCVMEAEGYE